MDNDAPPELDARARLTHDQAQELVLRIVSTQAESLLRTAYRNSLCDDDAHDAYQRSMEIFLRRARTLDPRSAHKWIHVVVKREAQQLRRVRWRPTSDRSTATQSSMWGCPVSSSISAHAAGGTRGTPPRAGTA